MEDCYFHTDYAAQNSRDQKKTDQLLNTDMRADILKQMDNEAQSSNAFIAHIRCLIEDKENDND